MAETPYLLEVIDIVKEFGTLRANDHVDLNVRAGEIHALLGENGAGKSTLVKMIYGSLQPTSGQFKWNGELISFANPAQARKRGIGMVFQHFSLFDALSIAENIALAMPGKFDMEKLSQRISDVSQSYGLPLSPQSIVADLSVGERQRIEIIRCLLQDPKLLIMDEPTSVLTPQEADQLFVVLQRLASEGCAILYISHRLEEVKRICQAATILRHGKVVASVDPRQETAASLAKLMIGKDVTAVKHGSQRNAGPVRLALKSLSLSGDGQFSTALNNISLAVQGGEIVAIAGVAGNGQSELFDAISGEKLAQGSDQIMIDGLAVGKLNINQRRKMNASFVPEERLGHGAVPNFPLSENIVLSRHGANDNLTNKGIVQRGLARSISQRVVDLFDVRKGKVDPEARALSGGNLQKFVIGREMDRKPGVLVVNQPTWGVDAGAASAIRQALVDLARNGSAVVVISQDLDEIFEIADRIAVISRGQLSEAYPAHDVNAERIGLLMAGEHETRAHG